MFKKGDIDLVGSYNSLAKVMMEKSNELELKKSHLEKMLSEEVDSYFSKLKNKITFVKPRFDCLEKELTAILTKVEPYVNYIRSGRIDTHMKNYGGCVSKRGV